MQIKPYTPEYEKAVIELWERCELTRPWNNPKLDIERKLKVNPEMFLVGIVDGKVAATVMGGYEGHRGWINYLAVNPEYRRQGLGRQMMEAIEEKLLEKGCPKINIQIRNNNSEAQAFYNKIGYITDDVVSMGKRLVAD
jgi:ribosomal protein S18 acetylase RimI-like enzyme